MRFNKFFMYIWWGILIFGGVLLLKERFNAIQGGSITPFDSILIAVFIVLALIPFFSEMSFLGITIKKDVAELKKDVKEEVKEIKQLIHNSVDVNNKLNASFNFGQAVAPPPDNQLSKLEERVKVIIGDVLLEKGIKSISQTTKVFDVPEDNRLLFSARYLIEKELRRIWKNRFEPKFENRRYQSINRLIEDLVKSEVLPSNLGGILRDVYSVCSPAIHAEEPTENQISFIKGVVPQLVNSLKEIA